jgi:hypothetical protein
MVQEEVYKVEEVKIVDYPVLDADEGVWEKTYPCL